MKKSKTGNRRSFAIRQRVSQIPANAKEDDRIFDAARGTVLAVFESRYTVPDQLNPVCNRTAGLMCAVIPSTRYPGVGPHPPALPVGLLRSCG
jgi:hypothetical protein